MITTKTFSLKSLFIEDNCHLKTILNLLYVFAVKSGYKSIVNNFGRVIKIP